MATIVFYDVTATDKQQLTGMLGLAGHHMVFIDKPLSGQTLEPDADMISVFITSNVTDALMAAMPKLKLIACRSTGYNNIDTGAAAARGIAVTNVPAYGEQTVAEYTFLLLLALSRKLVPTLEAVRSGHIEQPQLSGFDLSGKTLGILGAGHIGQCVARIAKGFGMEVLAHDLYPNQQKAQEIGFMYKSRDDVVRASDALTLHMPYSPENHHVIDAALLGQCKRSAILINTARGELVDAQALAIALQSGKLAGAGLDVVEEAGRSLLTHLPNVILTPHNAFNTVEAIHRINEATATSLTRYWSGETPYAVS